MQLSGLYMVRQIANEAGVNLTLLTEDGPETDGVPFDGEIEGGSFTMVGISTLSRDFGESLSANLDAAFEIEPDCSFMEGGGPRLEGSGCKACFTGPGSFFVTGGNLAVSGVGGLYSDTISVGSSPA